MTSSYPCCSQNGSSRAGNKEPAPSTRLFHVHGTNEYNTKAFEVPVRAASLNSNDVFVLKTPSSCYLWYGKVGMASTSSSLFSRGWGGLGAGAVLLAL